MELVKSIDKLTAAMEASDDWRDMTDSVADALKACVSYVEIVSNEEILIQNARFRLAGQELRDFIMSLDKTRRMRHNALMVQVNMLNRLCRMFKFPELADVDELRRESYYDFAKKVVDEYYTTGTTGVVSAA